MSCISCKICKGTGFVKRTKLEFCVNNPEKISSHYCYKCENRRETLKGQFVICKTKWVRFCEFHKFYYKFLMFIFFY